MGNAEDGALVLAPSLSSVHQQQEDSNDDWRMPLLLSLIAGMSTCLGAAVVFCVDRNATSSSSLVSSANGKDQAQQRIVLSHHLMSFSLALAGSVMVTVSVVSILPETFENTQKSSVTAAVNDANETPHQTSDFVPIGSKVFWERCFSIALGCALYLLLSKCAFPEPDAVLGLDNKVAPEGDDDVTDGAGQSVPQSPTKMKSTVETCSPTKSEVWKYHGARSRLRIRSQSREEDEEAGVDETGDVERTALISPLKRESSSLTWNSVRNCSSGADLQSNEARRAWRVAMLLFISLAVHNFPEGLAVAASTVHSRRLGLTTTLAIALHNIPEGLAISIPCLAARPDSPWLAFGLASLSGLAEPFGAAVALCVLRGVDRQTASSSTMTILNMGNVLAFVAGIMIMVAFAELFPEAARHTQEGRLPFVAGLVTGIVVMVASEAYMEA